MSFHSENVSVTLAKGICEFVPIEEYKKLPENVDYETALKAIKDIQRILRENTDDTKIVYAICNVFSRYKIFK